MLPSLRPQLAAQLVPQRLEVLVARPAREIDPLLVEIDRRADVAAVLRGLGPEDPRLGAEVLRTVGAPGREPLVEGGEPLEELGPVRSIRIAPQRPHPDERGVEARLRDFALAGDELLDDGELFGERLGRGSVEEEAVADLAVKEVREVQRLVGVVLQEPLFAELAVVVGVGPEGLAHQVLDDCTAPTRGAVDHVDLARALEERDVTLADRQQLGQDLPLDCRGPSSARR